MMKYILSVSLLFFAFFLNGQFTSTPGAGGSQDIYYNADSIITVEDYTALAALSSSHDLALVDSFEYVLGGITHLVAGGAYRKTNCVDNSGTCIAGWSRILQSQYVDYKFWSDMLDADRINTALQYYNDVKIGSDTTELIIIKKPIKIGSSKNVNIHGKLQNAVSAAITMTTDVLDGDTSITVPDGSFFAVGEWIGISDNNSDVQPGSNQTRRVGAVAEILNISENTLTVTEIEGDYTTSQNSYIGRVNNIIIVEDAENVTITGTGILDGNFNNQIDFEAISPAGTSRIEEIRTQCGLSIINSKNILVGKGLTIKNTTLHNLATYMTDNVRVEGVNSYNSHDKSFLVWATSNSSFNDNYINGATFEDGIILYAENENNTFSNNIVKNCNRYGIVSLSNSPNNYFFGNVIENAQIAFSIQSPNCSVSNLKIKSGPISSISILLTDLTGTPETRNLIFSNVSIDGDNISTPNVLQFNEVDNISFSNLRIKDNNALTQQIKFNNSKNISIIGGGITNCHDAVFEGAGSDSLDIVNFQLKGMSVTPTQNFSNLNLVNCRGFSVPTKLKGNFLIDGNIGVGTNQPFAGLHLENKDAYLIGGTGRRIIIGSGLTGFDYSGIRFSSSNVLEIFHAGYDGAASPILSANSTGRIGIRNSTPEAFLDISGDTTTTALSIRGQATTRTKFNPFYKSFTNKGLNILNESDQTIMTIENFNRRIGIGTELPAAMLDVDGTVRFSNMGAGSNIITEAYILGVEPDGDIGEVDLTAKFGVVITAYNATLEVVEAATPQAAQIASASAVGEEFWFRITNETGLTKMRKE